MKKLTVITLFIFWALVTAILAAGFVSYQNNRQASPGQTQLVTPSTEVLSMQEIAKHNSASSCWLLIDAKVYDVTTYINQHPGDSDTIIPTCGTDATKAYNTKGRTSKPSPHSTNAHELLKAYYIGEFGQKPIVATPTPSTQPTQPTPPTQSPVTPPTSSTVTLSTQEIAKHNTRSNCWLIIGGKVYNVTNYLTQHPGGVSTITPSCGKDGTALFEGLPHSTNAHQLLANFLVGTVGQQATPTPPTQPTQPTPPTQSPVTPPTSSTVTLSIQEIARHNTTSDCWMIVGGNVYNVTSYLPRHPGGVSTILRYCGTDGGAAFEGLPHSTNAHQLLAGFFIGTVGQTTTVQPTQQPTTPTTPTTPTRGGDDDD